MTKNAVHDARMTGVASSNEASFGVRHRRGFVIAGIVGLLLTLVGALETGELPFFPRLAYWETLMLSGSVIGLGVTEGIEKWAGLRSRPSLEMPLVALLIALPLTFMVVGTSTLFFRISPPSFEALAIMFGITFAISFTMTLLNYVIHWPASGAETAATVVGTGPPPNPITPSPSYFADRLPPALRSQRVNALQAEDHYLRVHLDGGQSTLVLMRLSDAIAELPPGTGAQTHRSWWVAKDAVRAAIKSDGRATLRLHDELDAPVSRSYYKALNDAGWFA